MMMVLYLIFVLQGGVSQLGGVHPRTVKNNDDGTFCLKELELKVRQNPGSRILCKDKHF